MIGNFSKVLQKTPKARYNSCWKVRWRFNRFFVTCWKSRGGNCLLLPDAGYAYGAECDIKLYWSQSVVWTESSSSSMLYCLFHRCVLLCEPLRMDARSSESWNVVLGRFRQLLLASYSRCIDQYEEHIRAERERRTEPSWSFCEYFVLQVQLTAV